MTNNTPSGAKKHRESTEPESHQMAKMFFFLSFFFFFSSSSSSSSSDGLVQIRVTLSRWFSQNSSIFHWAVHQPIAFFQPLTVKNYGFLCDAIFSSLVRMRTNHLATKCNYYAGLEIPWCAGSVGRKPVILQPILHRKPVRGDLLLCNRWQTSAQACICC